MTDADGRLTYRPSGAALMACYQPFSEWTPQWHGGGEYRGVRTNRHAYVRMSHAPWLLYDNLSDPFQTNNLIASPRHAALRDELDALLSAKLFRMDGRLRSF